MQEKLSQYDLLARVVPGGALIWSANWIMETSDSGSIPLVQGGITEAIAYALVAYVAGLLLDAIGRWSIEPIVHKIFGKPSRTFLKDRKGVSDVERAHYRRLAVSKLKLTELSILTDSAAPEAYEFACRRVMATFGHSNEKIRSMYVQYTLHRSLSAGVIILLGYSSYLCVNARLDWGIILVELCCLLIFGLGVNHWGFRVVRSAFELLDADSLEKKGPSESEDN